jgi:hypothetical protein
LVFGEESLYLISIYIEHLKAERNRETTGREFYVSKV